VSRVRPFVRRDISEVAALRRRVFEFSAHRDPAALEQYFERVFFESPWSGESRAVVQASDAQSIVHVDDTGRITGFLGVIRRPATFLGKPIRVAVCTQFMVDSDHRGLAGAQLIRTLFEGDHDLTLADVANDASRVLWERLGGSVAAVNSLSWTQPIRPLRYKAAQMARGVPARAAAWLLRPVFSLVDTAGSRWPAPAMLTAVPLTPEMMAEQLPIILRSTALRPAYGAGSMRWLLDQLSLKRERGAVRGVALLDGAGLFAGWFLYLANRGGTGDVVQVVAAHGQYEPVLAALFRDARAQGLVALEGRGDFGVVAALDPYLADVRREGPWTLVHSHRSDIIDAIERGEAFFSRLDGEWWMTF
jgi:hypothetical protein